MTPASEAVLEKTAPRAGAAAIAVEQLTTGYAGHHPAIEGVEFAIPPGELVGLIGPNGAGKSTLIKTLLGLIEPWRGRVRVLGEEPAEARRHVGYMPQAEQVDWNFPATVGDVVAMGAYRPWFGRRQPRRRVSRATITAAMDRVGVRALEKRQIAELSGGQQRRVLLARALVKDPAVFILDEPAAGLDAGVEEDMLDLFDELVAEGKTLIVATHDIACVYRRYNRALLLDQRLVAQGAPQEVLTEETLTGAFGRHVMVFEVGKQTYAAEPHAHPHGRHPAEFEGH